MPGFGEWRLAGPFGGSARSLAINPQNRNMLLAGSRDSMLFRSDDAGASWRLLPFPRGGPGTVNALVIDPRDSSHYFAGLDAADAPGSGVWESKDGGEHWQAQAGLRGSRIESLAMWPKDSHFLAAGTSQGVFFSDDGGNHWKRISREDDPEMQEITALAFDPMDARVIYAGTPHLPWKTTDAGATWYSIHDGLIDDSDIFSIRIDPQHPQTVLASACSGIYRSENAGGSWVKLPGIPGTHRRTHIIAEDPAAPNTIFAGTTLGLLKSTDAGRTWRQLTNEQVNWMVFDPEYPTTIYLATEYAGILKSVDSGRTFRDVNAGFANHSLTQITGTGLRLYASSAYEGRFGGVFSSTDGGINWMLRANQQALEGRNLNSLAAAPERPDLVFAASEDAVLKSVNGGQTWTRLLAQPGLARAGNRLASRQRIYALRAVQTDKLVLFAGTDAGLFRSSNAGASWQLVKEPGLAGTPVIAIYAPSHGATPMAAQTHSGLFLSVDSGSSWRAAALPDSSYYVYDLALSSDSDAPILAATSRGILQLLDGGSHWRLVTDGVPASTVESVGYYPENQREAFLVQYGKVYQSWDGGTSWKLFASDGLENSSVRRLWFAPGLPGRIVALSAARGALVFDLPPQDRAAQAHSDISTNDQ